MSNAAKAGTLIQGKGHPSSQVRDEHDVRDGLTPSSRTVGWKKTCRCDGDATARCIVLDPFIGSGTVALVALKAGRDFVGIELNPQYVKMAEARIGPERGRLL